MKLIQEIKFFNVPRDIERKFVIMHKTAEMNVRRDKESPRPDGRGLRLTPGKRKDRLPYSVG